MGTREDRVVEINDGWGRIAQAARTPDVPPESARLTKYRRAHRIWSVSAPPDGCSRCLATSGSPIRCDGSTIARSLRLLSGKTLGRAIVVCAGVLMGGPAHARPAPVDSTTSAQTQTGGTTTATGQISTGQSVSCE